MSDLREIVSSAALQLSIHTDSQVLIVVVPDDGDKFGEAAVSWIGNVAGAAYMLEAASSVFTTQVPRPDNCEQCGAAWDRIVEARLQLRPPSTEANHKMHGH